MPVEQQCRLEVADFVASITVLRSAFQFVCDVLSVFTELTRRRTHLRPLRTLSLADHAVHNRLRMPLANHKVRRFTIGATTIGATIGATTIWDIGATKFATTIGATTIWDIGATIAATTWDGATIATIWDIGATTTICDIGTTIGTTIWHPKKLLSPALALNWPERREGAIGIVHGEGRQWDKAAGRTYEMEDAAVGQWEKAAGPPPTKTVRQSGRTAANKDGENI